jgi:AraC-like DNA-binding protein
MEVSGFINQMRFYIQNPDGRENQALESQFDQMFAGQRLCAVFFPGSHEELTDLAGPVCFKTDGQYLAVLPEDRTKGQDFRDTCAGISCSFTTLEGCISAVQQALTARKHAFLYNIPSHIWSDEVDYNRGEKAEQGQVSQFVQQFPTARMEGAVKKFENLFFLAEHGKIKEKDVLDMAYNIEGELEKAYKNHLTEQQQNLFERRPPLYYRDAEEYLTDFTVWTKQLKSCLSEQFNVDQNRGKIQDAANFMKEHFRENLNMAMVSNHVSMNYSLFSITFKEYMGINFVNYLKNLRISEAKHLLESTDDIGYQVGYENDKHFLKTFKSICGVSPTEYRKNFEFKNVDNRD